MDERQEHDESLACRLYVILARSAPVAVVFRRGPSKWVQLVKWHTDRDAFEDGQWFHGRIYERRCDLSPDGSKLVYFASKFSGRTLRDTAYTCAWTAVSKPPFFTALALWPKGDCWHGGGLFEKDHFVWLNHKPEVAVPHPSHKPGKHIKVRANPDACGEDWPVWSRRMSRDGWSLVQEGSYPYSFKRGWQTERPEIWERLAPDGKVRLRLKLDAINFEQPGGPYVETFTLRFPSGAEVQIEGARWADWDQSRRLVFARQGQLFAAELRGPKFVTVKLADLNANKPRQIKAPDWAKQW